MKGRGRLAGRSGLWKSRGGIEHYYWVQQTLQYLKKIEFQALPEVDDIDIVAGTQGVAIEIETGKSNLSGNLLKLQKSQYSHLFMLSTNKEALYKIEQIAAGFPRIKTMHVKDFLKLSKDLNYLKHEIYIALEGEATIISKMLNSLIGSIKRKLTP